ncbi:cysteine proteinase [Thozetella sp. PMI_491]|nr:cysteine proteinase [Thozetella sp. PMI_491]
MELDAEDDVSRVLLEVQKQGAKKVVEKEKEAAKVEDILNQLEGLAVPGIPRDHIRFALNSKYAEGNVQKAVELIRLYQEAFAGIVVPYNPHMNMLGAENRGGVTCYLDAVLFAMFAKLEAFECMLRNNLADKAQRKLACLIRLWVNMLRSGKLIHTDVTERLQDALAACGWEDAHLLEQQDTSEAFAFITETLQLPLLQLRVDLFHQGKWDADDRKIVYERLLNLAVPPDPEGKGVKLEECLWGYFNNQVDVIRDSPEEEKIGDRPMLSSSTTMRLVTEQDNSEAATDYEPTPLQQRWTMPGSSASTSSTEPQLLTPRHRSTSIIQRIVLDEQGKPTTSDVSSPSLLEKVKHQGSMVAKPVTIPAWQFFRIIPWYATSNTEPRSDIEIVRQFSQGPIVAMCLKRYIMTESGLPKRQNTFIDIPDSLELTHFMMVGDAQISESNNLKTGYKLVLQSVVCHRGDSLHSGHYVTFARANPKLLTDNRRHEHDPPPDYEDAHWVKFDDLLINNRVSSVDDIKESLKEETPYLLFYQILPTIDVARVSTEEDTEPPPYNDYNLNVTSTHAPNIEPDRPGTAPTTPGTYQTHMPIPIDDYDASFTWSD